jgi:putative sigma-54 modulation protein
MRVFVKGTNVRVPQAVREYAEKKMQKLERYARFVREASLAFSSQRSWYIVEVTMSFGDTVIRAEEKSNDMYVSIDLAAEKVEAQLRRLKGRLLTRTRQATDSGGKDETAEELLEQLGDEEVEELPNGRIVRTKTFPPKPMTTEEAVLQMEMLGHDFFVFVQADSGRTAVVYARNDGDFGLLVPETA